MRLFSAILLIIIFTVQSFGQRMSLSAGVSYPISITNNNDYQATYINIGGYVKGTTSYYFNEKIGLELDIIFQTNEIRWKKNRENIPNGEDNELIDTFKDVGYDTFTLALLLQYQFFKKGKLTGSFSAGGGLLFNFNEKKVDENVSEKLFEFQKKASPSVNANLKFSYFPKKYLGVFIGGSILYSAKSVRIENRRDLKYNFLFAGLGCGIIFGG
ncbi:hypothetical protein OAT16_00175 [Prolixibacteraceae bacterium]|nr:hypothetical protein [Prolixibacteraceae bacterium]